MLEARWLPVLFSAFLVPTGAAATETGAPGGPGTSLTSLSTDDPATPFQRALRRSIAERSAAGLPVPSSVDYSYQLGGDAGAAAMGALRAAGTRTVTLVGRTTVRFDGPEQAGYASWPRLVIRNKDPAFQFREGDYTEAYRAAAAQSLPGIWDLYQFGSEPRNHVIEETITITYPEGSAAAASPLESRLGPLPPPPQLLMGFTYSGPHLDYTIGDSMEVCIPLIGCATVYDFKAGFELDWGLGLRLPAQASLSGPTLLAAGTSYQFSSAVDPLDWSATEYSNVGVAPENGNEFVLRFDFFAGVRGVILGADLCPNCYIAVNVDESTSFATPFGPDATFPIPPAQVPVREFGVEDVLYFAIGLQIQPQLGSQKITADWAASGAVSGAGSLTHTAPGAGVPFTARACLSGTDTSHGGLLRLDDFKYWFDRFLVELEAYLTFQLFGFGTWTPTIEIATFDLSPLTGGLWLGRHTQCDALFHCSAAGPANAVDLPVSVTDGAAPTTSIALSGLAGNAGWYRSDVLATLMAVDNPPGCGIGVAGIQWALDATWNAYVGPVTLSTEGPNAFLFRASDRDGNVEAVQTQVVPIDKTPPSIRGTPTTPANRYGWYNHDVVVHFEASDAVSGVASVTPDQVLSAEGAGQSVAGTAFDVAGNSASTTVGGISIDKTAPIVLITSPQAMAYSNTATLEVRWTAADALSGIASEMAWLDASPVANGQTVELLLIAAGPHQVSAMALDRADNVGADAVAFAVAVDIDGLTAALERVCQLDWIDKPGICQSLGAKLGAARASIGRGNLTASRNQLEAFLNELDAQADKAVGGGAYELLRADALYVLSHQG